MALSGEGTLRAATPSPTSDADLQVDLTQSAAPGAPTSSPARGPVPPYMKLHHLRSPGGFNAAYRRIYSRRERVYNQATPGVVAERLDIAEEAPTSPAHTARHRALTHLSVAYAAAGYAQSALVVVVSLTLACFVAFFARGLHADAMRKIRVRADAIKIEAAECVVNRQRNGCVVDATGAASHATPALSELCKKWAACERRGTFAQADAMSASVWAEAFADVVNSFADRISSTAVVLALAAAVVGAFLMSSAAFGFLHRRLLDNRLEESSRALTPTVLEHDAPFGGTLAASPARSRAIAYREPTEGVHRRSPAR